MSQGLSWEERSAGGLLKAMSCRAKSTYCLSPAVRQDGTFSTSRLCCIFPTDRPLSTFLNAPSLRFPRPITPMRLLMLVTLGIALTALLATVPGAFSLRSVIAVPLRASIFPDSDRSDEKAGSDNKVDHAGRAEFEAATERGEHATDLATDLATSETLLARDCSCCLSMHRTHPCCGPTSPGCCTGCILPERGLPASQLALLAARVDANPWFLRHDFAGKIADIRASLDTLNSSTAPKLVAVQTRSESSVSLTGQHKREETHEVATNPLKQDVGESMLERMLYNSINGMVPRGLCECCFRSGYTFW